MSRAAYQEPIRRSTILPGFTQDLASVRFRPHADFATLKVFTCDRLSCVLTKEACAANYTRAGAPISCKGCPIGAAHANDQRYESGRYSNADAAAALSCVRCERNAHTATRFTGRFRLTRKHTICVSCLNRELECVKGANSKGAAPRKWAHLRQATVTIENVAGDWQTLDIGLRSGRAECERYVARIHPGNVIVDVFIGGATIPAGSVDSKPADWHTASRETKAAILVSKTRKKKALPAASDSEVATKGIDWNDWDTPLYAKPVASDESDADGNGNVRRHGWLPPLTEEEDAAYRESFNEPALDPESIAALWDFTAGGLAEFVEWLCDGHAEADPLHRMDDDGGVPAYAPSVPSDPIADVVAPSLSREAVSVESEQSDHESESDGCSVVRDGEALGVCDYAREHGISKDAAATAFGFNDPDYVEPVPVATPEPEPVKKRLTGKQLRKLEKARRRAERQQNQQPAAPNHRAKASAIAARALAIFDGMRVA